MYQGTADTYSLIMYCFINRDCPEHLSGVTRERGDFLLTLVFEVGGGHSCQKQTQNGCGSMAPICPLPDAQKGIVEMLHILSENNL